MTTLEKIRAEIEKFKDRIAELPNMADSYCAVDFCQQIIDKYAEQEPKSGHWITTRTFTHDGEYYCDKCKCDAPNNEKWDFCPNCGAYMKGGE